MWGVGNRTNRRCPQWLDIGAARGFKGECAPGLERYCGAEVLHGCRRGGIGTLRGHITALARRNLATGESAGPSTHLSA